MDHQVEKNQKEIQAQEYIINKIKAIKFDKLEPPQPPPINPDKPRAKRHSETAEGFETLRRLDRPQFMPAKNTTFEDLGKYLVNDGARNVQAYLMNLQAQGKDETYFDAYMKLLQYFRPKVMAHAVKSQTEVIFRFDAGDQGLIDDV